METEDDWWYEEQVSNSVHVIGKSYLAGNIL